MKGDAAPSNRRQSDRIPDSTTAEATVLEEGQPATPPGKMTDEDFLLKVVQHRLHDDDRQEIPPERCDDPKISNRTVKPAPAAMIPQKKYGASIPLTDLVLQTPTRSFTSAPAMLQQPNWGMASDGEAEYYRKAQLAILDQLDETGLQSGPPGTQYSVIPGAYAVEGPGIAETHDDHNNNNHEDATGENEDDTAGNQDEEEAQPRATVVVSGTLMSKPRTSRRICVCALVITGLLLVVIVAVVIPLVVVEDDNDAALRHIPAPVEPFRPVFSGLSNETLEAIEKDLFSPAAISYDWVQRDPFLGELPEWKQRQRFALATVYESLGIGRNNGANHGKHYQRRYNSDECDWQVGLDSACTPAGLIRVLRINAGYGEKIDFGDTGLPREIALLAKLEVIDFSGLHLQMPLTKFVPYPVPSTLKEFACYDCELKGPIPVAFFVDRRMANLTKIALAANELTGSMPQDLGELASLIHLDTKDNPSLDTVLPTGLCGLREMTFLRTDWCQDIPANCSTNKDIPTCCNRQKARILCTEDLAVPSPLDLGQ